jgi:long-chain acyl-CoA synthetase
MTGFQTFCEFINIGFTFLPAISINFLMKFPPFEITGRTIPSIFLSAVEAYRERTAFNYLEGDWKTVTYGELAALVVSLSSELASFGIKKGDRVAIISENRPHWCAAYLAVLMRAGIAVPIDTQLGEPEIRNLLTDSGTVAVFHSSRTEAAVAGAIAGLDITRINLDNSKISLSESSLAIAEEPSPDDIASIIYTSGTTGNPKGVMLTHRNFTSDAEAVIRVELVTHDDNVLSLLPYHHTYPFMGTFLVPLFLGAAVTFAPGLKAAELTSAIRDTKVTLVVSVPRLLEMIRQGIVSRIKDKGRIGAILVGVMYLCGSVRRKTGINPGKLIFNSLHRNFGILKFFASGGARLDPAVMNDMEALGFTILEGYGLTETAPVITYNPMEKRKAGSVGKALPGVEIRIADDGEIIARGEPD